MAKKLGGKSPRQLNELLRDAREGLSDQFQWTMRDHKIPPDAENAGGLTALFYAVRGQRHKIVKFLIDKGADVNAPLPRQPSLLDMAQSLNDKKLVRTLKDAGAQRKPPKQLEKERQTLPRWPTMIEFKTAEYPLYEAAVAGDQATFTQLAGKLSQRRLQTLLSEACIEHEVEFGKALIACLDKIDYEREDAPNPLFEAAAGGCLPLVKALHEAGAKRDLLMAVENAAMGGHAEVVAYLMDPMLAHVRKKLPKSDAAQQEEFQRTIDRNAKQAVKDGYTRVAEAFLPHCTQATAKQVAKSIERRRAKNAEDAPADRFATYRGGHDDKSASPDLGDDFLINPGYLWMDEDSLKSVVKRAASKKQPLEDRLSALKTLAQMGPNAESSIPTLNQLTQDPEKRIRKAAQKALQAVRKS